VWVDEIEIAMISRFLRLPNEEVMRQYVRVALGDYSLVEFDNGDCVFWSRDGCAIYPVRPTQCRTFPFWHEYTRSAAAWAHVARRCPGVNRGKLYTPAEVERLVELTDI
jgi:hypothetical protein